MLPLSTPLLQPSHAGRFGIPVGSHSASIGTPSPLPIRPIPAGRFKEDAVLSHIISAVQTALYTGRRAIPPSFVAMAGQELNRVLFLSPIRMDTDHTNAACLIIHPCAERTRYDSDVRGDGSSPRRIRLSIPGPFSALISIMILQDKCNEVAKQG